ncbi:AzlD domain-containing protein [Pectinatus sottacetonis]|uniref:AzlD domain-containing protein n=1 Tax=Pectinatus sottacetonis TaxID=1002795 RepID=UPI0018C5C345
MRDVVIIFLMAIATWIPKITPIMLSKDISNSNFIRSFLYYIPYAALSCMIFPAILNSSGGLYYAIIGGCTSILLSLLNMDLIIIILCSTLCVILLHLF